MCQPLREWWRQADVQFVWVYLNYALNIAQYFYFFFTYQTIQTRAVSGQFDLGNSILSSTSYYFAYITLLGYFSFIPCTIFGNMDNVIITIAFLNFPLKLWAFVIHNNILSLVLAILFLVKDVILNFRPAYRNASKLGVAILGFFFAYSGVMVYFTLTSNFQNFNSQSAAVPVSLERVFLFWSIQLMVQAFIVGAIAQSIFKLERQAYLNLRKIFFSPFCLSEYSYTIAQACKCCCSCLSCLCFCPELLDEELMQLSEIAGNVQFNGNYWKFFNEMYTNSRQVKGDVKAHVLSPKLKESLVEQTPPKPTNRPSSKQEPHAAAGDQIPEPSQGPASVSIVVSAGEQ
eukprot:TRINITY_DN10981_c0_g1_i1.p1 TRINITY_DN10981_c0_g1~~TRINITY_DN10981_c0_g1_i1.p1  ORF type:complete len:345 (-),score=56.48 TRINITY_DN10981_c0_g1_i1:81-1115(-)